MNALLVLMTALRVLTVPTLWAHLIASVKPAILEMAYLVPVGNVKMASTVENICKKNQDCCLIKKRCNPDLMNCQKQRAIHFRNKWRLVQYFLQYIHITGRADKVVHAALRNPSSQELTV